MPHSPETGTINQLCFFLICVLCISGSGFVWYQILSPIRTLFYSKSESGIHVTEMMTYDWLMIIVYVLKRFLVVVQLKIMYSSFMLLSAVFIFIYGTKNWRQKMVSIYGAGFLSMCCGHNCWVFVVVAGRRADGGRRWRKLRCRSSSAGRLRRCCWCYLFRCETWRRTVMDRFFFRLWFL